MPSRSSAVKASGRPSVPGARQRRLELLEAAQSHARHQFIAVAEMPIGRGRADPGKAGRLGERESGCSLSRDQFQRGADQRLAQIAVMIAARAIALAGLVLSSSCKECLHRGGESVDAISVSMLAIDPATLTAGAPQWMGLRER